MASARPAPINSATLPNSKVNSPSPPKVVNHQSTFTVGKFMKQVQEVEERHKWKPVHVHHLNMDAIKNHQFSYNSGYHNSQFTQRSSISTYTNN